MLFSGAANKLLLLKAELRGGPEGNSGQGPGKSGLGASQGSPRKDDYSHTSLFSGWPLEKSLSESGAPVFLCSAMRLREVRLGSGSAMGAYGGCCGDGRGSP